MEMIKPKYEAALDRAEKETTAEKKRGVGLAVGVYNTGRDTADVANSDIELNPDGTVTIYNTWEDGGQGADIGSLATAHEALKPLGLSPEQIRLYLNDTAKCPNSGPAAASRCQYMVGSAIIRNLVKKGYTNLVGSYHSRVLNEQKDMPLKLVRIDLKNQEAVKQFFKIEQPDYVFLAAAKVTLSMTI